MSESPSFHDLKTLSAYLDGELNAAAAKKTKNRLTRDPNMRAALDDLRAIKTTLRQAPQRRAPKNFTLSARMVAQSPPMPRLVPLLNYASVLAMLLFFFTLIGSSGSLTYGVKNAAPLEKPMLEEPADAANETIVMEENFSAEQPLAEALPQAAEAVPSLDETPVIASRAAEENLAVKDVSTQEQTAALSATPSSTSQTDFSTSRRLSFLQIALLLIILLSAFSSYMLRLHTVKTWRKKP